MTTNETIIRSSKAAALKDELEALQLRTVQYLDFYDFNQHDYTVAEIAHRYKSSYKDLKKYTVTIPLTQQFIRKLAKIFKDPPTISIDTNNTTIQDDVHELLQRAQFNSMLLHVDRMVELTGLVGVLPIYNPHTERVELQILMPDRCIVFTYEDYPQTPEAVAYRINSQGHDPRPRAADEYMYWTKDRISRVTFRTNWTIDREWDVKPNPYGRIPIAWFAKQHRSDGFWIDNNSPLVLQNLDTNIQLTNLDLALDYQAFATLVTQGLQGKEITVGVTRYISLPEKSYQGTVSDPNAYYINPNVDLRQVWEIIQHRIELTANMMGLSTSSVRNSAEFSSGYQLRLSMLELIDLNDEKRPNYIEPTRETVQNICDCYTHHNQQGKRLPFDMSINVNFAEQKVENAPREEIEITTMKINARLMSRLDAIMLDDPDLTEKEAIEKLKEIDQYNISQRDPLAHKPDFTDEVDIEDEEEEE